MHITTRKRLAGVAALAFGGSVLLGACDGEPSFCNTLAGAIEDLEIKINSLESQQSQYDEGSPQWELYELKITALEEAQDFKQAQYDEQCAVPSDGNIE